MNAWINECFTFNAPDATPPGWENRVNLRGMQFQWRLKNHFSLQVEIAVPIPWNWDNEFSLFVHNKGQMYFPKTDEIFGSHHMSITVTKVKKGYYDQHFTLTRIRWKTLDSDVKRCDEDTTLKANTTECITHHLEDKIGAFDPFQILNNPHILCCALTMKNDTCHRDQMIGCRRWKGACGRQLFNVCAISISTLSPYFSHFAIWQ